MPIGAADVVVDGWPAKGRMMGSVGLSNRVGL